MMDPESQELTFAKLSQPHVSSLVARQRKTPSDRDPGEKNMDIDSDAIRPPHTKLPSKRASREIIPEQKKRV